MIPAASVFTVTDQDFKRLSLLIDGDESRAAVELANKLGRAKIVPQREVVAEIVTMNSQVVFTQVDTGADFEVWLVYPKDTDILENRISILSPVGVAILGLHLGDTFDWELPNKQVRKLRLVEIPFQPEARRKWHL